MTKPETEEAKAKRLEHEEVLESTKEWTPEELLSVKHLGPGVIGERMYKAAQAYDAKTDGGKFGPAILGVVPDKYKDSPEVQKKKDAEKEEKKKAHEKHESHKKGHTK